MSDYAKGFPKYTVETRCAKRRKVRAHIANAHKYARHQWRGPPAWKTIISSAKADEKAIVEHGWNPDDKSPRIGFSDSQQPVLHAGRFSSLSSTDCIRGKRGYTDGVHVWQVRWPRSMRGSHTAIGVGLREAPLTCRGHESLVGWTDTTWGWNIAQQKVYHDKQTFPDGGRAYPLLSRYRDIPELFHMVLDMTDGTLSFLVEGKHMGVAFSGLKGRTVYPMASCTGVSLVQLAYVGSELPQVSSLAALARGAFKWAEYSNLGHAMRMTLLPQEIKDYVLQMPSPFPEAATVEEVERKADALTAKELDQLNDLFLGVDKGIKTDESDDEF